MCSFHHTATTHIYTLSLHDALPICWVINLYGIPDMPGLYDTSPSLDLVHDAAARYIGGSPGQYPERHRAVRSEEHTSELQSRQYLVCRLLLEKKKSRMKETITTTSN